jgi:hypothetical protein
VSALFIHSEEVNRVHDLLEIITEPFFKQFGILCKQGQHQAIEDSDRKVPRLVYVSDRVKIFEMKISYVHGLHEQCHKILDLEQTFGVVHFMQCI